MGLERFIPLESDSMSGVAKRLITGDDIRLKTRLVMKKIKTVAQLRLLQLLRDKELDTNEAESIVIEEVLQMFVSERGESRKELIKAIDSYAKVEAMTEVTGQGAQQ